MNAQEIISQACGLPLSNITLESKLSDPIEWDSLAQIMIIGSIEESIGRELSPNEFEEARSFKGVENLLKQ